MRPKENALRIPNRLRGPIKGSALQTLLIPVKCLNLLEIVENQKFAAEIDCQRRILLV
jgi:hypothetical protein